MEILVCIKQVPGSNKVEVDPVTGVLKRNGADSKMNPYDLYALECGMKLKEQYGGRVSVITMGPPPAATIIREAFAMGADEGALVSDRAFGGADVLATSYTLAQGIKKMGNFDVIICGLQTRRFPRLWTSLAYATWQRLTRWRITPFLLTWRWLMSLSS